MSAPRPGDDAPGTALHVELRGEADAATACVLAHGFAGSARNFRPQVDWLRERAQVATYDARGHARSKAVSQGGFAMDVLVDDFRSVVDRCAPTRLVAGGLSLGAATALRFALAEPERVAALVLASLPAGAGRGGGFSGSALDFAEAVESEGLDAAGARFVWGADSRLDARGASLVRQGFLEHRPEAIAAILRDTIACLAPPETLAEPLRRIGVPTLVIAGGEDASSLGASRALAAAVPELRLEIVEGAGHVVNLVAREAFDRLVASFLDEHGL